MAHHPQECVSAIRRDGLAPSPALAQLSLAPLGET